MLVVLLCVAVCAALAWSAPARAQDAARVDAGLAAWKSGGCSACHGTFAEGGVGGEYPVGPSLRATRLTRELLVETISCGRPGTPMPYNLVGAYTKAACYGMAVGQVPAKTNPGGDLSAADIEALVDYLGARIVGKGAVTKAECGFYFGNPNDPSCSAFR